MRRATLSTAKNVMVLMTDSTNPRAGLASLTLTITASKDGAAYASISPTVTDRGNGMYNIALTSSHTDTLGELWLHVTATGANTEDFGIEVQATSASQSDVAAIKAKTDNLPADPADASDVAASVAAVKAVGSSILAVL